MVGERSEGRAKGGWTCSGWRPRGQTQNLRGNVEGQGNKRLANRVVSGQGKGGWVWCGPMVISGELTDCKRRMAWSGMLGWRQGRQRRRQVSERPRKKQAWCAVGMVERFARSTQLRSGWV